MIFYKVRSPQVPFDFAAIYFNPLKLNYDIVRAHGGAVKGENLSAEETAQARIQGEDMPAGQAESEYIFQLTN